MYIPEYHAQRDLAAAHSLIETYPLGAWVVPGKQGLIANHLPFFLDKNRGEHGTLIGHVSRANPVWQHGSPTESSVVLFQGPQTYISPGWYPGKTEHGKVVPTWNYAVVHAHGAARFVHDEEWLVEMLSRLTDANEQTQSLPWQLSDAPQDYIAKLLRAIVGIEIPIERLESKLKVSQDEAFDDRLGTVKGLKEKGDENALAMACLVEQELRRDADA